MEETVIWTCETCPNRPVLEHEAFVEHARQVHGLSSWASGTPEMLRHADAREWFSSTFRWTFDTCSAVQVIKTPRIGEDLALWMGD